MQGGDRLWGAPPLNSYNTLNMCSREVTWQVKNIITFYYRNAYDCKYYQGGDILQVAPLNQVILRGHVIT